MTGHKGQVVGYIRVSTTDQKTVRQDLGDVDRVFEDKLSGKDRNRPQLDEMLKYVRDGDTVRVHSMDRLARSLGDLVTLVRELTGDGVSVEFVSERLTFAPGKDDPSSRCTYSARSLSWSARSSGSDRLRASRRPRSTASIRAA